MKMIYTHFVHVKEGRERENTRCYFIIDCKACVKKYTSKNIWCKRFGVKEPGNVRG